jgi:hypothetical protein
MMKANMKAEISGHVKVLLATYEVQHPDATASALRELWLQFEPKSHNYVKAEQREQQKSENMDVKKTVSFAIRVCARGETDKVRDSLRQQIPPRDPAATWVLCDAIRSMGRKLLPEFVSLRPLYEQWTADPNLPPKNLRSVKSILKTLSKQE